MNSIPQSHQDLLNDEKRAFVFLGTSLPDGSVQVTPVWFNTDGTHFLINTAEGRLKDRNMRARPSVTLCIPDPANPYRYLQVRGKVVDRTTKNAVEHINQLNFKYHGDPAYPLQPGMVRVIYKILPEKIDAHG